MFTVNEEPVTKCNIRSRILWNVLKIRKSQKLEEKRSFGKNRKTGQCYGGPKETWYVSGIYSCSYGCSTRVPVGFSGEYNSN